MVVILSHPLNFGVVVGKSFSVKKTDIIFAVGQAKIWRLLLMLCRYYQCVFGRNSSKNHTVKFPDRILLGLVSLLM